MPESKRNNHVIVVQDPFTSFYDAQTVESFVNLLKKMGKQPVLLPFVPNGKAQHVKGFLEQFEKTASSASDLLNKVASLGIDMVGCDASLVLCYRDEYVKILADKRGDFRVDTIQEWLSGQDFSDLKRKDDKATTKRFNLLAHCSEKTAIPETEREWVRIFTQFGLELHVKAVGCCGMAGTYGHELEQQENSKGIYNLSWKPTIDKLTQNEGGEQDVVLATGFSCRSQVKRYAGQRPQHPVEVLNQYF
jgi:Fe-S oxidoreductase